MGVLCSHASDSENGRCARVHASMRVCVNAQADEGGMKRVSELMR